MASYSDMKIKILGTRGEIEPSAPKHSKQSGILLDGKIMFDIGEKTFLKEKPKYIFITHLHPDHAFFVRHSTSLPLEKGGPVCAGRLGEAKIFAPEKHPNCPDIKIIKKTQNIAGCKITAIPTVHSKRVKSNAYLIEKGKKRLLYTGDMIWIKKTYHPLLKNLDLIITEGSFMRKGGMVRRDKKTKKIYGHNGAPDLTRLFKKFTKHIIFVHFGSWFYKDIKKAKKDLEQLGRENEIKVEAGYDGMNISL